MKCPGCGAENREGSNFCRYCARSLTANSPDPTSGYIPSVPPPPAQSYAPYAPPVSYEQPPRPPARPVIGQLKCPRCGSTKVIKGSTPLWAVLVSILGFFVVCFFSLLFLLIRDRNHCLNCGLEFR